jgi:hypothetical protein
MSRIHPECSDSDRSDRVADVVLRQEPDEEQGKAMAKNMTRRIMTMTTATRSEPALISELQKLHELLHACDLDP